MNSGSSVNETNLVNFPADISTLNQLDTKDGLLSFSLDHIYACHSESADRRHIIHLDKEIEISTHCVVGEEKEIVVGPNAEIARLSETLDTYKKQNKKLRNLLVYHLDLIQQQNVQITKGEKSFQALKQENDNVSVK